MHDEEPSRNPMKSIAMVGACQVDPYWNRMALANSAACNRDAEGKGTHWLRVDSHDSGRELSVAASERVKAHSHVPSFNPQMATPAPSTTASSLDSSLKRCGDWRRRRILSGLLHHAARRGFFDSG